MTLNQCVECTSGPSQANTQKKQYYFSIIQTFPTDSPFMLCALELMTHAITCILVAFLPASMHCMLQTCILCGAAALHMAQQAVLASRHTDDSSISKYQVTDHTDDFCMLGLQKEAARVEHQPVCMVKEH